MSIFDKNISQLCKSIGEIGTKIEVLQNKDGFKKVEAIQNSDAKFGGVYVLWENEKPIYVGLSKDIVGRIKNHKSANISMSSLASHLIREKVAAKGGGIEYMVSSFYNENRNGGKTKTEVENYIKDNELKDEIDSEVKERINNMYFTCVEEEDYLQQALIEIFCMKLFDTITTEKEPRENIDAKNFKYIKYNFSY